MHPLLSFDWLYLIGTISFSISGYLIGARKNFDLLGVGILALLTATGGGLIRDVLVGRSPVIFLDAYPVLACFSTVAFAWLIKLHQRSQRVLDRAFIIADSIGLVAFSIAGAQLGLAMHYNLFGVAFLGFITAIGGGLVRDMMINDISFVLHRDFYGSISILVAVLLFGAQQIGANGIVTDWALFLFGFAFRLIAHSRNLSLPRANS